MDDWIRVLTMLGQLLFLGMIIMTVRLYGRRLDLMAQRLKAMERRQAACESIAVGAHLLRGIEVSVQRREVRKCDLN